VPFLKAMLKNAIQPSVLQDVPVAKTTKQFQIELKDVERQLDELSAPVRFLEAEIGQIRATIERGKALSISDHADFLKQGGDLLIAELSTILEGKLSYCDSLRTETQNLQEPLQITKSNLLALLAQKQEKSFIRKEREEHGRVNAKSPINLSRWVSRAKMKPTIWKVIAMAQKREDQILNEICELYQLKIVSKKDLSDHYARKYAGYRIRLYKRGFYLIPDDQPKGRNQINQENYETSTHELSGKAST
jgi:uncharacterized protein YsxB (DUF464 family)